VAGQAPLDERTVYAVGLALAHRLGGKGKAKFVLGTDTRESCGWIAATLTAGLEAGGATVESAGVITTPAVAYLARQGFCAGVVISASHNPWRDNGIKVFGGDGFKLDDRTELGIEQEIFARLEAAEQIKKVEAHAPRTNPEDLEKYVQFLLGTVPGLRLDGMKIVVDCANGAASAVAPALFARLGGEIIFTHATPDGRNINEGCGALHPEVMAAEVKKHNADMGVTFDGDADRAMLADHEGRVANGDAILLVAARDMKARGLLAKDTVVATTMSNMGLEAALKRSGIRMLRAGVGDRYVHELMVETGATLGGEQSGHMLFPQVATTGDGILTALLIFDMVKRSGKRLAELRADMKNFPQVIVNVKVKDKLPLEDFPEVARRIAEAERELADSGRVVIRYSGTEPLARVMIEAESEEAMRRHAESIAEAIRSELGV
jgi:phosphoglucosamine mutase